MIVYGVVKLSASAGAVGAAVAEAAAARAVPQRVRVLGGERAAGPRLLPAVRAPHAAGAVPRRRLRLLPRRAPRRAGATRRHPRPARRRHHAIVFIFIYRFY